MNSKITNKEMQQFENELIQSIRDMKNRHFAAKYDVVVNDITKTNERLAAEKLLKTWRRVD